MLCEANIAGSFERAARMVCNLADTNVNAKRVQLVTERIGLLLQQERDEATKAFMTGRTRCPKPEKPIALMVISADGGRVQTLHHDRKKKWREDKVGIIYDAIPTPERDGVKYRGPKPITRSVVSTMDPWDRLGDHISALADARGYEYAIMRIFISDGAAAIRSLRERCFFDAIFILDWAHAVEHLYAAAIAAHGPGSKADDWYIRNKTLLWNGRCDLVISHIKKLSDKHGKPPKRAADGDPRKILANNVNYFQTNRDGMDYPTFRKNGWPIGSGHIEATIKVLGKRVKGTEKHWSVKGAEETLQVMTLINSNDGRWGDFWLRGPGVKVA